MKNITALILFLLTTQTFALSTKVLELAPTKSKDNSFVNRKYYSLSFSPEHKQAEWVFYKLTKKMIKGSAKRSNLFNADPKVNNESAHTSDYTNTGFDRGHLLPAADMKLNQRAMDDTFFMSNISPQKPRFNRALWKRLESRVRGFVQVKGSLFVYTGPVLEKGLPTIGDAKISVPQQFYKIIVKKRQNSIEAIAFLMENEASSKHLSNFVVTIDDIERLTGIDFLSELPDEIEEELEKSIGSPNWDLN